MKSGLKPVLYDRRDYDFHPSFGTTTPISFPDSYNIDLGIWQPSQNGPEPFFGNPALPYGCTDYTQADLCANEDGSLKNPILLENVTQANAKGGLDVRISLQACKQVFGRTAYFNITPKGGVDFFDSIRLAMLYTREEKRAVSAATPWYPEWVQPVQGSGVGAPYVGPDGILPMPYSPLSQASWHNWEIVGWKQIHGKPYLIGKPWIGPQYADNGFCYMSREVCNYVFSLRWTAAFTISKRPANATVPVSFDLIGWILTWFKSLVPNG